MTETVLTLPIAPEHLFVGLGVFGLILLSGLVYWMLAVTGREYRRPAWEEIPEAWRGIVIFLGLLWAGLFALTVIAAYDGVWKMIHPSPAEGGTEVAGLGFGALLAAMLGAPFVIWGTVLKHRTVTFQKEGHITDRINKAVEMLGAEKTVERIGRPVTIWTGKPERISYPVERAEGFEGKPRTLIGPKEWSERWNHETDELESDHYQTISVWPDERTVIQWQGETLSLASFEHKGIEGSWQVFKETVPNIEVRIGAILSLERIAQDSTAYDKGRDHVRVMEILCAYVRENSNARKPVDFPEPEWKPLEDGASEDSREKHLADRKRRFGSDFTESLAWKWAQALPKPRADVDQALKVLGRRSSKQRKVEAAWPNPPTEETIWPFDKACPELPEKEYGDTQTKVDIHAFVARLQAWGQSLSDYGGYRLDLRNANLQGADLSNAVLSGAKLRGAGMGGANLSEARMEGADLYAARMEGANLCAARMECAYLGEVRLEGANLSYAKMIGADLSWARIDGADLNSAVMQGSNLTNATIEVSDLSFANMTSADLSEAKIGWALLRGACLEKAQLGHADLAFSDLSFASLEGSWFLGSCLDRAKLNGARMDPLTNLCSASLRGSAVRFCDFTLVRISQEQTDNMFGDQSVILPKGINRPDFWLNWEIGESEFETEWQKWLVDPINYKPSPISTSAELNAKSRRGFWRLD